MHLRYVIDILPPENPVVHSHGCVVIDQLKDL